MRDKVLLMDEEAMERAILRIAHQIIEKNKGAEDLALIGIQTRGVQMAQRLRDAILKLEGVKLDMGVVDITFYRDDLSLLAAHPVVNATHIPFSVEGRKIILADDVIYTGRTARAAIEAIMDLGRASLIQLAVMIDRGHRELPIKADYVGKNVPTSKQEAIAVRFMETDGSNCVVLQELD